MAMIPSFDPSSLDHYRGLSSAISNLPSAVVNTRIDWRETPEAHVFKADLPGLKKEEVKVEVEVEDGRIRQISGERSKERKEKTDTWHCVERRFLRWFRLPENAKMEEVTVC